MKKNEEVTIFQNAKELFQFAANDFFYRAMAAIHDKGEFVVVLSGGNTPKLFFDRLADIAFSKKNFPWSRIQFFFGDERYVPSDDAQSNYHMAYLHLFSKVPINPKNVFPIPTHFKHPETAAKHYAHTLHGKPRFDLVYLGLGEDGHTASLMPSTDIVKCYVENPHNVHDNQLVASLYVPTLGMYRITLTPPAINHGQDIIFLVTGANKAKAVWEVLNGKQDPLHFPAQLIHSTQGKTLWYLDQSAGALL